MEKNLSNEEALKKLKELAEEVRICMFAITDIQNEDYGRPMSTIKVEEDGTMWFFTKDHRKTANVAEKSEDVCLYYSHPGKNTYLTVKGKASEVRDEAKKKELYTPVLKAWFPNGLDDPEMILLKVTPEQAHYWDTDAAKLVVLYAMIKAAVTGQTADTGNHGDLSVKR